MTLTTSTHEVGTNVEMLMLHANNFVLFVILHFMFQTACFNICTSVCTLFNEITKLKDLRTKTKEEEDLELGTVKSGGQNV